MFFEKLVLIILLILPIYSLGVLANATNSSQKIYPPYPEVWGYDVSNSPAFISGGGTLRAFRMKDGDIWFLIGYNFKFKDNLKGHEGGYKKSEYLLIKFFKQDVNIINGDNLKKLFEMIKPALINMHSQVSTTIKFRDGSKLNNDHLTDPKRCTVPDYISHYLVKTDSEGKQKKYSILGAYPGIKINTDEANCEAKGAAFIYQKLFFLSQYIIDLNDDTFLIYSDTSNLILRFDKNLKTKFKPKNPISYSNGIYINRNYFVIEYDLIEKLQQELSEKSLPLYQAVHDHLLLNLREKYNSN